MPVLFEFFSCRNFFKENGSRKLWNMSRDFQDKNFLLFRSFKQAKSMFFSLFIKSSLGLFKTIVNVEDIGLIYKSGSLLNMGKACILFPQRINPLP